MTEVRDEISHGNRHCNAAFINDDAAGKLPALGKLNGHIPIGRVQGLQALGIALVELTVAPNRTLATDFRTFGELALLRVAAVES